MKIYILDHDYPNAVPEDGSAGDIDGATRFVKLEDAHAALADVLATAQQRDTRIAELESQLVAFARQKILDGRRIAELEAAIDKLAQCKGRFHTEASFKALIEVRNKSLHK